MEISEVEVLGHPCCHFYAGSIRANAVVIIFLLYSCGRTACVCLLLPPTACIHRHRGQQGLELLWGIWQPRREGLVSVAAGTGAREGSSSADLAAGGLYSKAVPCPAAGRVCRGTAPGVQAVLSPGAPGAAGMLWAKAPASRSGNSQRVGEKLKRSSI